MSHPDLEKFSIIGFQEDLVGWFVEHQRELPWRENKDPYRVWVSEIMLQQTRVDTVIPYYTNFMREFPTAEALANADEEKILKAWEGLGYYSRVRNLQSAVREVVEHYEGVVPNNRKEISALKGVGPYTAGAILSIAYDLPEPAVDGNVMRVLSRVLLIKDDIAKPKTRTRFEAILYELISKKNASFFNQGLMELGALVCTPTSPGCLLCPVREHCRAYEQGVQTELPIKSKKKKQQQKNMIALVIKNELGEFLIEKRPDKGLLARLWQFVNFETEKLEQEKVNIEKEISNFLKIDGFESLGPLQEVEHVFSHLKWHIHVYELKVLSAELELSTSQRWVQKQQIEDYAFPVSHQKIIEQQLKMEE
ncbi:DNA glycosylase [Alkalihalobacillus alcalophilus ATCC 27647 = CGMCC 1.3604]|uniref:Adenine DNA glycosylase n=1 Tax=Alkalihalobacillus alcalophilus ATCC 27647 = CGMCC 1.3604 TaxID=1218173 RepID=A0A4S4K123_ALKAL|nr:A/G-specific adenine glycosylase [Alkalihalobacillus alcalophilus]MED1562568.1 A/G-specific adenine glycosylase [Alkalihalobacillus alcalophilus]THG91275.1 DNA glycosylase [Alkalihalobacillus alcalophilus ATCC 27647 = CGMCC 1.3604]